MVSVEYENAGCKLKKMVVDFDGQHISYPISNWYANSEFFVPHGGGGGEEEEEEEEGAAVKGKRKRSAADINTHNERQFSKVFPDGLELASTQTVHKYQGSQQDNVVVVMYGAGPTGFHKTDNHHNLNMLYTAASRAKKRVRFIMDEKTLEHFIETPTLAEQDKHLIDFLDKIV